jgi:hypothetical protein
MDALRVECAAARFSVRKNSNSPVWAENGLEGIDGRCYNNNRIESNQRCDIAIKIATATTTTVRGGWRRPAMSCCSMVTWPMWWPLRWMERNTQWMKFYGTDVHAAKYSLSFLLDCDAEKLYRAGPSTSLPGISPRRERERERGTHNDAGDGINRWIYNRQYIRY